MKRTKVKFLDLAISLREATVKYATKLPDKYRYAYSVVMQEACGRVFYCLNSANAIYIGKGVSAENFMLREILLERARVDLRSISDDIELIREMMTKEKETGLNTLTVQQFDAWNAKALMLMGIIGRIQKSDKERYDSTHLKSSQYNPVEDLIGREKTQPEPDINFADFDLEMISKFEIT